MSEHNLKPMSEVMKELRNRGYKTDYIFKDNALYDPDKKQSYKPKDVAIDEDYRFEGETNPDDQAIMYAISAGQTKGILIDSYGVDPNLELQEFLNKVTG